MNSKILTHTEVISQQAFEDYSKSYSQIAHILMDLPLIKNLPQTIAEILPNHYTAVSLGSGDGKETSEIVSACDSFGKQGTFINVDPFINQPNVLKISSQEFIHSQKQKSFDLILLKCSFHFNKDQDSFFKAAHLCLKETGKILIIQMGNQCRLPWTPTIQTNFLKLLLLAQDFIPKELFKWELIKGEKEMAFNKAAFRKMINERCLSNLLTHTQGEIDECLAQIDSQERLENAFICFWLYIIEKI